MSKERLEGIPHKIALINHSQLIMDAKDYQFLYKQAERVQELEKVIEFMDKQRVKMGESHQETISNIDSVIEQNKRYQEALEFINEELELVLHSNKGLAEKMFYIENSKRKITEVLEGESNE